MSDGRPPSGIRSVDARSYRITAFAPVQPAEPFRFEEVSHSRATGTVSPAEAQARFLANPLDRTLEAREPGAAVPGIAVSSLRRGGRSRRTTSLAAIETQKLRRWSRCGGMSDWGSSFPTFCSPTHNPVFARDCDSAPPRVVPVPRIFPLIRARPTCLSQRPPVVCA